MVAHKAALQRLWKDTCTVVIREKIRDPDTKITDFVETVLLANQPCKLSFQTLAATDGDHVATAAQSVKLFISVDIEIPAGSKIIVTRGDRTMEYSCSGAPGIFTHHQEIELEPFRGWA